MYYGIIATLLTHTFHTHPLSHTKSPSPLIHTPLPIPTPCPRLHPLDVFYCPLLGSFSDQVPPDVRGGFICEEMGMGKTIITLSLFISNPAPALESLTEAVRAKQSVLCVYGVHFFPQSCFPS